MNKISFVIPCFNNEENIDDLFNALFENEQKFKNVEFEYILIDDASKDKTVEVISRWQQRFPEKIKVKTLERNKGSHKAVFVGLSSVTGTCIIIMAADLQDPPELSIQMYKEREKGNKLVIAVKGNTNLPFSSRIFHFIMRSIFVKNAPEGAFDYALFDRSLLTTLLKPSVKNCNIFYRLAEIQPEYSIIYYQKRQREKGRSGWTLLKKISFFIENILMYLLSKLGLLH